MMKQDGKQITALDLILTMLIGGILLGFFMQHIF